MKGFIVEAIEDLPDCIRGFDENQGYIIWPTLVSLNVA